MTDRLVIRFPSSSITIDSDNVDNISALSNFCKEELGAYRSTENIQELTVDNDLDQEKSNRFNSKLFELGLIVQ